MGILKDLVILAAAFAAGISMMIYRERIVRVVGKNEYAERYLGAAGSYTMWVLLGAILIVVAIVYVI